MSYCRWSSDNWRCDLYCYEGEGWITHVGANRIIGDIPEVDWSVLTEDREKFSEQYEKQMNFVRNANREPIDLPYAGDTFTDYTLEDFYNRLVSLRAVGYNIPEYVFERVREEMK